MAPSVDGSGARGYPRPQLRRAGWESLNGRWDFAIDAQARVVRPDEAGWERTIVVPFSPETPASGVAPLSFLDDAHRRLGPVHPLHRAFGDNRHALAELLRDAGRQVTTARDGVEALEKLDSLQRPALILLDLMMPRMDGLEFLRHLSGHEHADEFPVFVMSADDGLRRIARRHPRVRGTFRKPFYVGDLLSAMAEQH